MNSRHKSTRREFLTGQAARDALAGLSSGADLGGGASWKPASGARRATQDYLLQLGRRAMACEFQVYLNAGQHAGAVEAANEALDLVQHLEDQLSVFRPESDVSAINRQAGDRPCRVESRLFALLCRCADWNQATGGAYDITAAPLVKIWGFHTRSGRFPTADEVHEAMQRSGSRHLTLDRDQQTVRFDRPGMELNLGSVGKGYALDRCAEVLSAAGVQDFLIHGGHSSILAHGARDPDGVLPGWSIALRHPLRAERRLAELQVCSGGVGTSGSGQQFFYHRGRRYGHVLDPRSGRPAEGVLSATVLAPDAAEADALSTAFFVLGVDATRAYCEARQDLGVVFVLPGTRAGTVAIETIHVTEQLRILDEGAVDETPTHGGAGD
ncbi:MAG: FAD:protein FMN transferase [Planctomycetaceae bacterium]|nr:FAD:protein FMN transferase [Planctomycetaceae bacterium]